MAGHWAEVTAERQRQKMPWDWFCDDNGGGRIETRAPSLEVMGGSAGDGKPDGRATSQGLS